MNRKNLIAVLCLALFATPLFAQKNNKSDVLAKNNLPKSQPFQLIGEVDGYTDGYIVFYDNLNQSKKDTVKIVDSKFLYKGNISEPSVYTYLRHDGQSTLFFMDPGDHNIIIDYKDNKGFGITNSPTQESYNKFNQALNPYFEARMKYQNQTTDSAVAIKSAIENNIQFLFNNYLKDSMSSPHVVAFLTLSNIEQSKGNANDIMEQMYKTITPTAKNTTLGKKARKLLDMFTADDIGKIAPDFKLKDANGKSIKLSDYRGKNFVLVDFWATWCGPCRAEFPALMEAKKKYESKDLVILGVSIDADYAKWKTYVADGTKTNWTHIWDGPQGPNQVVQTLYSVPSIPRNFLLDKEGRVIAKNLRGAAVEQKLAEFLK
jgi:thiol-disulfide isomerase/thioredoxin